ncbi:hypothetical protein E1B28_008534 [Marasmius oreades]|uniref:Uncharacterized protein n=1 Tax=Marasmius oreades TaxID=181124 RepID=A0A9P7USH4_9AGAR|nr:uncharacterized protein E1B28_008534 [Marasmius oreades]KAG7092165.1 hypothetical protein E1B28_008534 [Marasmius oreades]
MESTHQDTEYLVRKTSNAGYRAFSLITPPLYTAYILARRGRGAFSINGVLRSTWIAGVGGAIGGAGIGYARYAYTSPETVRAKRVQTAYDTNRIRAEDHSTIGGILFSVITPAVLWKRAKIYNLILGGLSLGSGVGTLTHYFRAITGDPPPQVQLPDAPYSS